jgi:hypothetical protein
MPLLCLSWSRTTTDVELAISRKWASGCGHPGEEEQRYIYTAGARDAERKMGRLTQIALLREWHEDNSYAAAEMGQRPLR